MAKVKALDLGKHIVDEFRRPYGESEHPTDLIPHLEQQGITLEQTIEILGTKKKDEGVFWNGECFRNSYTYHVKSGRTGQYNPVKATHDATLKEIIEALHEAETEKLDRRLSLWERLRSRTAELAVQAAPLWVVLAMVGVLAYFIVNPHRKTEFLHQTPESHNGQRWQVADEMKADTSPHFWKTYKDTPPDLVSMASSETGIDEVIFRAMIAYGKSDDSSHLREKGYKGLIPVDPIAAGVMPRLLENDDYESLLAFAYVFKEIRRGVCDDETALGVYLTSEDEVIAAKAKANHATFVLKQADARLRESKGDLEFSARIAEIRKCVIDGRVPDESLFEPMVVPRDPERGSEEWLRAFYERVKEMHKHYPDREITTYKMQETRLNLLGFNPGKEPVTKRDKFERESAWFANLPDYAANTVARVVEDIEW